MLPPPGIRKWDSDGESNVLIAFLAVLVFSVIALGAVWGFPVQDDGYLFRMLRSGGPRAIVEQHADRPLYGFLLEQTARLFGEKRLLYITLHLLAWLVLAAETAALWKRLYPNLRSLWPVAALASVSPVIAHVQFTTVTTVYPDLLPVELVLAALILTLSSGHRRATAAAFILPAAAAALSEYGVATSLAAATFLLVRRKERSAGTLFLGTIAGYVIYHSLSDVTLRKVTNPSLQWRQLLDRPVVPLPRVVAAVWDSLIGVWGHATARLELDWHSKSSLGAAALALLVALIVARLARAPAPSPSDPSPLPCRRTLWALIAAVAVGLLPAVMIKGWPPGQQYATRYLLPISAFACCATIGLLVAVVRWRYLPSALALLSFLAAYQLATGAWEERRLSLQRLRTSNALRAFVQRADGLTVLVEGRWPERNVQELIGRMTYQWNSEDTRRVWIERPEAALVFFGARRGCRDFATLTIDASRIKWPRPNAQIAQLLFDESIDAPDFQPYYLNCSGASEP